MTKIWLGRTMLNEELGVASSEKKLKGMTFQENGTGNSLNGYYT